MHRSNLLIKDEQTCFRNNRLRYVNFERVLHIDRPNHGSIYLDRTRDSAAPDSINKKTTATLNSTQLQ